MSVPKPPVELVGHCATIYDDVLYVLSPSGFQTLPLKSQAQWSEGASGQTNVTDPACVQAGEDNEEAMYVIGGTSDDSEYSGLQRYVYSSQIWETLSLPSMDMRGRTNHGVAYLKDSQQILVYAGSTPEAPSDLSSQTFAISTQTPHNIESFTSQAPPLGLPLLQSWNSSHALMVGGAPWNIAVYTFGPDDGWQQFGTNLTEPLPRSARALLVNGDDGSKVLNIYNVTASPNTVSGVVLSDANGDPAATGTLVGTPASARKRKRDLTLNDWPTYNSTNAPTATRLDCAVISGSSGLVAIAAGSSDSPVALFDQSGNAWIDANKFFDSKQQQPLIASSTSSSTPTATASSTPSSTSAAAGSGGSSDGNRMRTLGIILGVLFGVAAFFIIILLLLRWRRNKKKREEGYVDEKQGGRMSFADRGTSFKGSAVDTGQNLAPPKSQYSSAHGSHTSLNIISGKFGGKRSSHQPKLSTDSTRHLVKDKNGTPVGIEPVEMVVMQNSGTPSQPPSKQPGITAPAATYGNYLGVSEPAGEERKHRSSGWSRYFATSTQPGPNGLGHIPSIYVKKDDPKTTSMMSDASRYSTDDHVDTLDKETMGYQSEKMVDGQRVANVSTYNPAFSDSREDLSRQVGVTHHPQGQSGQIVNPYEKRRLSALSGHTVSTNNDRSTLSSNITASDWYNESGNTPWTPTSGTFKDHIIGRPPSSIYTNSVQYEPRARSRGGNGSGFFPGAGTSHRPSPKAKTRSRASSQAANDATGLPLEGPITNGLSFDKPSAQAEAPDLPLPAVPVVKEDQPKPVIMQSPPIAAKVTKPTTAVVPRSLPFRENAAESRDSAAIFAGHEGPTQTGAERNPQAELAPPRKLGQAPEIRSSTLTLFPSAYQNAGPTTPKSPRFAPKAGAGDEVLAAPRNPFAAQPAESRDSTVTIFPRGVSTSYYEERQWDRKEPETGLEDAKPGQLSARPSVKGKKQKPVVDDMSWVNLSTNNGQPTPP